MIKKTLSFSILATMLFLAPRFSDTSSAYYNEQNGTGISLTSNNNFCVGETPTYYISAGMANAIVTWISYGPKGQTQTSFTLSNTGTFSGNGSTWQTADLGSWTKLASINGISQSLQFQVSNCGNVGTTTNTTSNNTSGNTYYNPYDNNILAPLGNSTNTSSYEAPGNTYYDPYNNNIFQPLGGSSSGTTNQNTTGNSYQAPGNTYYDPYGNVPCLTSSC